VWGFNFWPYYDLGLAGRSRDLVAWLWDLADAVRRFRRWIESRFYAVRSWPPSMWCDLGS
jgi:hypothetical protein